MKFTKKNRWILISLVLLIVFLLNESTINDSIVFSESVPMSISNHAPTNSGTKASRGFAGPNHYPPSDFAAYGIVAFKSRPSDVNRDRFMMFCHVYIATLPHTTELFQVPLSQQMVTVWPIESDSLAIKLNRISRDSVCKIAVDNYGLVSAVTAANEASNAGVDTREGGPYLFAWSPASAKGQSDVLVLFADLSFVTTHKEALAVFMLWRQDIESDPLVWNDGFNLELIKTKIRLWADLHGPGYLNYSEQVEK